MAFTFTHWVNYYQFAVSHIFNVRNSYCKCESSISLHCYSRGLYWNTESSSSSSFGNSGLFELFSWGINNAIHCNLMLTKSLKRRRMCYRHTLRATVCPELLIVENTSPKVPSPILVQRFICSLGMQSSNERGPSCWHSWYTFSASLISSSSWTWESASARLIDEIFKCYYIYKNSQYTKHNVKNHKNYEEKQSMATLIEKLSR